MRFRFNEVFRYDEGRLQPLRTIKIGSVFLGPRVKIGTGATFCGVGLFDWINNDIEAEEIGGILVIIGFYTNSKKERKKYYPNIKKEGFEHCPHCKKLVGYLGRIFAYIFGTRFHNCSKAKKKKDAKKR